MIEYSSEDCKSEVCVLLPSPVGDGVKGWGLYERRIKE